MNRRQHLVKKLLKIFLVLTMSFQFLISKNELFAQEGAQPSGLLDESLQDIYVVLGVGAAGAILGLSTLSFVDKPKDHLKNIAVGGAIGIVIGVGIVIFGQASKSQSSLGYLESESPREMTADLAERLARKEFGEITSLKLSSTKQNVTNFSVKAPFPSAFNFNFTF